MIISPDFHASVNGSCKNAALEKLVRHFTLKNHASSIRGTLITYPLYGHTPTLSPPPPHKQSQSINPRYVGVKESLYDNHSNGKVYSTN